MIGSKLEAGLRCVKLRNIIAVEVIPKIARGVNTLCHRVNMGDGGSGVMGSSGVYYPKKRSLMVLLGRIK